MHFATIRTVAGIVGSCLLLFCCSTVNAEDSGWQDKVSINGFYTLDLTYSDDNTPVFANGGVFRPLDSKDFTGKNSLIGLQARYNLTDDFSAYLQGATLYDVENNLDFSFDWAYFSYDAGNDFTVRLGKFQIPFLQGTELKSVGFSRLWARPITPASGAGGFLYHNGMEFLKNVTLGDGNLRFQAAVGNAEHVLDAIDGRTLGLVSARYSTDNFWLRAALLHVDYNIFTNDGFLIDGNAQADMGSIEAEATYQNIIVNAGLSDSNADISPNDRLAYLSVGYRMGNFTPYILGKAIRQHFTPFEVEVAPPPPPGGMSPPPQLPGQPATPDGDFKYNSLAMGFRLDLDENHALKMQLEHIDINNDSLPNQGTVSKHGNVLSIIFEGVF